MYFHRLCKLQVSIGFVISVKDRKDCASPIVGMGFATSADRFWNCSATRSNSMSARQTRWRDRGEEQLRVLLIEDDQDLAVWLQRSLQQRGLFVEWEEDGIQADRRIAAERFDAIVLDLGLPMLSGGRLLDRLRDRGDVTPLMVITARDDLTERIALLHAGADDFLSKPFSVEELEARLVALVRRSRGHGRGIYECGSLSFNQPQQVFWLAGSRLALTAREHAMLAILIQRVGQPISKQQILDRLISADEEMQLESVEVLVYRLRKRLENSDVHIITLRGLGYFLEALDDGA
jgi:two-component system, OmpR family, response regulator TctD